MAIAQAMGLESRIEVLEIDQFLAANLYEWSGFSDVKRSASVKELIDKYNEIVVRCETDPSLKIEVG